MPRADHTLQTWHRVSLILQRLGACGLFAWWRYLR